MTSGNCFDTAQRKRFQACEQDFVYELKSLGKFLQPQSVSLYMIAPAR